MSETLSPRDRMLAGLPVTSGLLDVNGIATSVLEGGDGPPLVLLHGGIECGGAMWAPVLTQLVERHRVVVPDVPGLGESAPAPRLDVDTFTSWFTGLLEQMNIERPTLVAHSLLGSMAARVATRQSSLLARLVVYAAPAVGPYRMPMRLRYVAIRFAIRPSVRNAERFERFALLDRDATHGRDPEWFEAFSAYTRARATVPHVKQTMRHLVATQTKPIPDADLRRIDVPTTLLWGRDDRMAPLAIAEGAARRHGWPLHVIDDCAHAPHIEQPDAFLEALAAATANV
ncbi:MAG: alpha/beta hydrolase [Chloroflexota bacterium]|nr:alpha/beta hydrolase [Chloroflexota bacterium]